MGRGMGHMAQRGGRGHPAASRPEQAALRRPPVCGAMAPMGGGARACIARNSWGPDLATSAKGCQWPSQGGRQASKPASPYLDCLALLACLVCQGGRQASKPGRQPGRRARLLGLLPGAAVAAGVYAADAIAVATAAVLACSPGCVACLACLACLAPCAKRAGKAGKPGRQASGEASGLTGLALTPRLRCLPRLPRPLRQDGGQSRQAGRASKGASKWADGARRELAGCCSCQCCCCPTGVVTMTCTFHVCRRCCF